MNADALSPEHARPDRGDGFLELIFRRRVGRLLGTFRAVGVGQGFAIDLLVGGHRKAIEEEETRGDHDIREPVP